MGGGNADTGSFLHEVTDAALDLFHRKRRQYVLDQVPGGLAKCAAGIPRDRVLFNKPTEGTDGFFGDSCHSHGFGVHPGKVAVCGHQ